MSGKPTVSRITIYPIKALDGITLTEAVIGEGGCLLHDREYAMTDANGNFIIGKSTPLVHSLRSMYDLENGFVSFRNQDETVWNQFHFQKNKSEIQSYLSKYFGVEIQLHQNTKGRFLDIPDLSGATILSTESLKTISQWFENMTLAETRRRFRATCEIEGVPAFWEDNLFLKEGTGIEFKIGDVTMFGISPRARCVVPTRNPDTGEVIHAFPKSFTRHRAASVPVWSNLDAYGHHYFLSTDCHIPASEIGKWIRIGDEIKIIGEKIFY